jgi:hypothetical protein
MKMKVVKFAMTNDDDYDVHNLNLTKKTNSKRG